MESAANSTTRLAREHAGAGLVAAAVAAAAFPDGLFNPTGYAAVSVAIWAVVIGGLASRVLPTARVGWSAAFAGLCLAGTAVLATVSIQWANDQGRAFDEAVRVSFYLGLFTLAACTASRAARREWISGLTIGLSIVSLVALFAYLQPGLLDGGNSDIPNAAGRLSYPIGYWNGAAALLAGAGVLGAYAGAAAPSRAPRAVATALIPVAGLGIWLAHSRGGAVAAAIGVVALLAASPRRSRQLLTITLGAAGAAVLILAAHQMHALTSGVVDSAQRSDGDRMSFLVLAVVVAVALASWFLEGVREVPRPSRRLLIGLGILAAVAAVIAIGVADPAEKFREFKAPPQTSNGSTVDPATVSSNGRWQFWSAAVDAFDSAPVEGVGAGGFEDWWAQHGSVALFVRNPHSLPLQQAAELGLIGLALFLGFIWAIGVAAWRRLAKGPDGDAGVLLAVVLAGGVGAAIDWTWEIPAVFAPVVVCAALLSASAPDRRPAWDTYWLGLATVTAAWLAMIGGGLVVLGQLDLRASEHAAAQARVADGIDDARSAHTALPWSAEPYTQLALLEEQQGNFSDALGYLRDAQDRDSSDWRLALIEARLQRKVGDAQAANAAIERARNLSPRLPIFQTTGSTQG
jgi:hypothetical protein